MTDGLPALLSESRRALGVVRLAFAIHDPSFPADPDTDLGHGSPYGTAGLALLGFVGDLGFDTLQLGPQGETSAGNESPYDGASFSRRGLSADLAQLCGDAWGRLLSPAALEAWTARRPADATLRAAFPFARRAQAALLREARSALASEAPGAERARLRETLAAFRTHHAVWLGRDALFECLEREHPGLAWTEWGDPDGRLLHPRPGERETFARRRAAVEARWREAIEAYAFAQFVVHEQHRRFRAALAGRGLRVYGDLQIGLSTRDAWAWQPWLLRGYRMGAPPSRTNPDGQPWGYAIFDPGSRRTGPGPRPVLQRVSERMGKLFDEYDGLRLDHPHGLVCPWVYRSDDPDPFHAVQHGARLFASPDLPDHPDLAAFAIPRRDQLTRDPAVSRFDDGWVTRLEPAQVDRYAELFDVVVEAAHAHGAGPEDLACEVLSTLPHPLARVLDRHGLGRFRVTQKLDPDDPSDPYRLERARPADWVMIGTHDTPPLWQLLEAWAPERAVRRARYAAERLVPRPEDRAGFAEQLVADRGLLAQAMLAELFASAAGNVMVFFSDLFGLETPYNRPGIVSAENWSLRLPPDWRADYRARLERHRALNLPLALALALRARGRAPDLQAALWREAARAGPVPATWMERDGA